MSESNTLANPANGHYDAIVVGAGFSGLYLLHRLRQQGLRVRVFEAGDGVGGTWFWNRYPGARCDVESMEYCYSFDEALQQEWQWSERYPGQPEILSYLNHVADRFDLRRDIQLETRVTAAHFDETAREWKVSTNDGGHHTATFCIMASGCLSAVRLPPFPGIEKFSGKWYHTAQWPREGVDFTGMRVGVVGTGSTGIQVIPQVAQQASHLHVFQRTPNFSIPAHNGPLDREKEKALKARYAAHRAAARQSMFGVPVEMPTQFVHEATAEERQQKYEAAWEYGGATRVLLGYMDLLSSAEANDTLAEFVRNKIRETVKDPAVAKLLCPTDHPLGTKRICVDSHYYATYNRPNVTLVDVRTAPIEEVTSTGLRTTSAHYELDALVLATGFDAMTGSLAAIDIRGREGVTLKNQWRQGPATYLGIMVSGFPNLFIMTGPGSPSVLSNMVVSIEQHVEWASNCIADLRRQQLRTIEVTPQTQDQWMTHVTEVANTTLFPQANSWYTGANIPGKPKVFMPYVGGVGPFAQACADVAARNYPGCTLSA